MAMTILHCCTIFLWNQKNHSFLLQNRNSCCLLQPFTLTCILQWTKNWKRLQGSQSNLEAEQKTAPWVEGQFLSFCKNSGGTQSTDELPNAIHTSADWLYNLPQSLTAMEWIGHSNLLGSGGPWIEATKCRFVFSVISTVSSSLPSN